MIKLTDSPPWSPAAAPIWSLVCGLPGEQRRKRPLLMLKAYVDDSGRSENEGAFVFAGVLSTAERWAQFSDEWKAVLDMPPRVQYFHAVEAANCRGQFDGFSDEQRNDKIRLLNRLINKHVLLGVCCTVDVKDWRECAKGQVAVALDTPYFHTAAQLMVKSLRIMNARAMRSTIDFIFDDQHEKEFFEIQSFWLMLKEKLKAKERWRMGDMPITRNDKVVLPLQAADLVAWTFRRAYADFHLGVDLKNSKIANVIQETLSIPIYLDSWGREDIRSVIEGTKRMYNAAGHVYEDKASRSARFRLFQSYRNQS